jgi:hypothetical protein
VSAISTIGGVTGHHLEPTAVDQNSLSRVKKQELKDNDNTRKGSSMSNNNQFQINTPSALGYTSVLFGQNNFGHLNSVAGQNFNTNPNLSITEELELRAQHLIFQEDQEVLDQYRLNQDMLMQVDPLGDA